MKCEKLRIKRWNYFAASLENFRNDGSGNVSYYTATSDRKISE